MGRAPPYATLSRVAAGSWQPGRTLELAAAMLLEQRLNERNDGRSNRRGRGRESWTRGYVNRPFIRPIVIRHQHPDADAAEVLRLLRERFGRHDASSGVTTGEDLVVAVFDALEALHVPFMLSGSREQRLRCAPGHKDADLVLELEGLPLQALAEQLRDTFVVDAQLAFETVTGSRRVLARARPRTLRRRALGLTGDPHDRERFARRQFV